MKIIEIAIDDDQTARQTYQLIEEMIGVLGGHGTLSMRGPTREEILSDDCVQAQKWYRQHENAIRAAGVIGAPDFMIPF